MTETDDQWMQRAIALATKGLGWVEPNPMVGCVMVRDGRLIGEGFHQKFGQAHAEINAILDAESKGLDCRGATAYVTLEPCSHTGKTGPCSSRLLEEGVARVVIGHRDPFPEVSGRGIEQLRSADVQVDIGVCEDQCKALNYSYLTRVCTGRPWVIAKWAMSLDGKIATSSGDSRWITSSAARQLVQRLRGRVDGILVGANTAILDDPMLTARPADQTDILRIATRIVLDSNLRIDRQSKLVATANQTPTLIACGPQASPEKQAMLENAGCDVLRFEVADRKIRLRNLLSELANRSVTNLLVEGGSQVFAMFSELGLIDEIHVFLGSKLIGGASAPSPVGGAGAELMADVVEFDLLATQTIESDLYSIYRRQEIAFENRH